MSKENIQRILNAFTSYMEDTQNLVFQTDEITGLKKLVFSIMNNVNAKNPDAVDIHKLNIQVLTLAKDHFVKQNKSKPNIKNLEREKEVFGDRKISVNEIVPQRDPYLRKSIPDLDRFITERDEPFQKNMPDVTSIVRQVTETAENSDDFIKKLKKLESDRSQVDENIQQTRIAADNEFRVNNTLENQDPKRLYTIKDDERFKSESENLNIDNLNSNRSQTNKRNNDDFSSRQSLLIENKSTKPKLALKKYISINSIDREWERNTFRYNYSVTFNGNGLSGNYKNIRSIEVGKVVIPEEINETINALNFANKTQFNHEFSFSYPYLILRIDEFNDVYDGTNDAVRKSFCKLVYHRSYKAPNGRGYVILKPFQQERKYFYPSPLSNLSRLTISLLKPNGFLVNKSSDSYKIFKLDYDPYNPNFFNVVSDVFFDKNEFFVGDVILFKGFEVSSATDSVHAKMINDFMNRPEGHEITQIGSTNNNGFYRSFYINAIGEFDKYQGKFNTDLDTVQCLNAYNDTIDYNTFTGFNGYILNTSLQNTIGMKLDVLVNDMSDMETALV